MYPIHAFRMVVKLIQSLFYAALFSRMARRKIYCNFIRFSFFILFSLQAKRMYGDRQSKMLISNGCFWLYFYLHGKEMSRLTFFFPLSLISSSKVSLFIFIFTFSGRLLPFCRLRIISFLYRLCIYWRWSILCVRVCLE